MVHRREDWEVARRDGLPRFLLRQGVLMRGIPMALLTAILIQMAQGGLEPSAFLSASFHQRFLLALAVFSAGGAVSAYAHWKALEKRFGSEERGE